MPHDFQGYIYYLQSEERSPGTIANYLRHLRAFARWLDGAPVEKSSVVRWKTHLLAAGYTPATINGMLASLHSYFHFRGWAHCRVRYLRVQRKLFRADHRALSRGEYQHLLRTARARGWRQLALVVETLGATGIRVSELSAITVEAAQKMAAQRSILKERSAPSSFPPGSATSCGSTPVRKKSSAARFFSPRMENP